MLQELGIFLLAVIGAFIGVRMEVEQSSFEPVLLYINPTSQAVG